MAGRRLCRSRRCARARRSIPGSRERPAFRLPRHWTCGMRSYRYRRLDRGVALVVLHFEVLVLVFEDRRRPPLDVEHGVGEWPAAQLQFHLLVMVAVDVAVAAGPDEVADGEVALLRHHVREQGVAGDVEWHAQENVGAALVQ